MKLGKHQRSKQRCQDLCWKVHDCAQSHTLCMNYVANTFLLISSLVRSKQLLCFVHRQGLESTSQNQDKRPRSYIARHVTVSQQVDLITNCK